jgi:hypothetical protein
VNLRSLIASMKCAVYGPHLPLGASLICHNLRTFLKVQSASTATAAVKA